MNELSTDRSVGQIAVEINVIKEQARNTLLQASVEIGRRLVEAKTMMGHGNWKNWLAENVEYSERTAQNLMSIYHEYGLKPASEAFDSLPYSKALELLKLPSAEREEFIEENDVEEMSTRELEAAIKDLTAERKKNADLQLDIAELTKSTLEATEKATSAEGAKIEAESKADQAKKLEQQLTKQKSATEKIWKEKEQLEKELAAAKDFVPEAVTVEMIPPDIDRELRQLRELAKKAPNEIIIKFRTLYSEFEHTATILLNALAQMGEEDKSKYSAAFKAACERIAGGL